MNKKSTLILLTNLVITGPMITDASASIDVSEGLGILRKQIKEEARSEVASQTDFMPHKINASIQADGPDTFVWDGIGVVLKDVTNVRITDRVTRIEPWTFHIVIY